MTWLSFSVVQKVDVEVINSPETGTQMTLKFWDCGEKREREVIIQI